MQLSQDTRQQLFQLRIVSTTLRSSYFEIVGFLDHVLKILEMVDKNFCLMSGFYGNTSNNAIFSKK